MKTSGVNGERMKVLVTGGAGYIGSHVCKTLSAKGRLPIALDNLVYGRKDAVRWGPLIQAEIEDKSAVLSAIREHRPSE